MEDGYEYLMDLTVYEHSDNPAHSYYVEATGTYRLYGKAIGNITKFRVKNRYDIRTFPSKRIKVFDYDTCRLTEVKVNASFEECGDTLYFKLPYAE
jgi:hypothetical protein